MGSEIKNVMIIGASGDLGAHILTAFLNAPHYNITVLSRASSTATFPPSVKVVRADYDSTTSLQAAFTGQDAVVSAIGSMVIEAQIKLIDAAVAAGVKRYMPSEYGSDVTNPDIVEVCPFFQVKIDVVEYLKKTQDRMAWTSVVSGVLYDYGLQWSFFDVHVKEKKAVLWDGGKGRFASTPMRTVGKAVVGTLDKAVETKNRHVYVSAFNTTQIEVLAEVEEALGTKFEVEHKQTAAVIPDLVKRFKAGEMGMDVFGELLKTANFSDRNLSDIASNHKLDNELVGIPKEDIKVETRRDLKDLGFL